ncbi:membrane protein [Corynebacterium phocae]|uniref:Membrane protein n=2 Tax=Corynebacterium phocae TaxID=161895 RepID=A0A1L7D4R3_9CORY|nr:membrane protein [Corynebacterium phocae]KAA8722263.1 PH domain-containing protein [Corynebacterium phocae]
MHPVSPKLARVRLISNGIYMAICLIAALAAVYFWGTWWWIAVGVVVAWTIWLAWLIPAQVRRMAWLETEDELLITKGKVWHKFTIVPYGRIQFVDVEAGPIARAFGLKKVELHTASAGTDATVVGLEAEVADALRERLTIRARERMSGL